MIVEYYEDVIILSGELRSNFWETIHTTITLLLRRHPTGVIIDCSGITEITSEGAETFQDVLGYVKAHEGARIIVAAVPEHVSAVLRLVPEVRSQLAMATTVEEARRSLDLLLKDDSKKEKRQRGPTMVVDRTILACLTAEASDTQVLHVTEELVRSHPAKVYLTIPVIVPRELPIGAPMPGIEEAALEAIEKAKQVLQKSNVPFEVKLERARDLSALLHEVSEEIEANYVVVALPDSNEMENRCAEMVQSVLHRVKRPLLFVRSSVV
jgi:anti-anti-sigma regulatory factor